MSKKERIAELEKKILELENRILNLESLKNLTQKFELQPVFYPEKIDLSPEINWEVTPSIIICGGSNN